MDTLISREEEKETAQEEVNSPEMEGGSLDLSALPEKLFHLIVRKLNYVDFARLEETCMAMATALNNVDYSLTHSVPMLYINKKTINICRVSSYDWNYGIRKVSWHVAASSRVRIHADRVQIDCQASSNRMKAASRLFEQNNTTAKYLWIMEPVAFEADGLDRLIEVLRLESLTCIPFMARKFFMNPENGLNKLKMLSCVRSGCTDDELFRLKNIPELFLGDNDIITDGALNKFLKQWKRGQRQLKSFSIMFNTTRRARDLDRIVEGLDANPIWTPALHEHSLVSAIDDFPLIKYSNPRYLYSLWKSDSPADVWKLKICQEHVSLGPLKTSERSLLLSFLNGNQYYLVTKTCKWCGLEFCEHGQ